MASLEILLATCNSARYLGEQLASLEHQTYGDFTILVADDGSTDGTPDILQDYQRRMPNLMVCDFPRPAGGACANFARLVERCSADYMMFCDHDDVWLPTKVSNSLKYIQALEARHGSRTPLLVHSDLAVTGPTLEILHASCWQYMGIRPARNAFHELLLQNTASGCALTANRALYMRARPIPANAYMHDHWFALVAAAFGKIEHIGESQILYRQHGNNTLGAGSSAGTAFLGRARDVLKGGRLRTFNKLTLQGIAFKERHYDALTVEQKRTITIFTSLWSQPRLTRCVQLYRHGLLPGGFKPSMGTLATFFCYNGDVLN